MFETKKTLIVVYKDELLMNQLKKMVETRNDSEQGAYGTRDDSVNIVSWTEKVWLGNKKAGNIQGKILFLGKINGTDKLIPVIDIKFDEHGVKYGWAGNQAVVFAEPGKLASGDDYDAFMEKLSGLPIPEFLKTAKDGAPVAEPDNEPADKAEPDDCAPEPDNTNEALSFDVPATAPDDRSQKMQNILKVFRKTVSTSAVTIKRVGTQVASKSEEIIKKKPLLKRQMLFYGVVDFYYNGLEKFMNS